MGVFWWIPALIPLVGVLVVLISPLWPIAAWQGAYNRREIKENWVRFGAFFGSNLVACFLISVMCWMGSTSKQNFKEVWNYCNVSIKHETEWTEEVTYTVTVDDGDTTDSDGNVHHNSHTETRHRTDHYGPYWKMYDEYGNCGAITESEYNHWRRVWRNEKQTGKHPGSSAGYDTSIDGKIYECYWTHEFDTICPGTAIRSYVNKIRVSDSVFKFGEPTKKMLEAYPRPVDVGNTSPFVSYGGSGIDGKEMMFLQRVNASMGTLKQIHAILVVFGPKESREVINDVLKAWAGPNKNELVTFISLDGDKVRWVEVHSWMDNTTLHAVMRDELMGKPFSIFTYGNLILENAPKLWQRKHFTPINAYLHVSVHPGWIITALLMSIIVSVICFMVVKASTDEDCYRSRIPLRWGHNRDNRDFPW